MKVLWYHLLLDLMAPILWKHSRGDCRKILSLSKDFGESRDARFPDADHDGMFLKDTGNAKGEGRIQVDIKRRIVREQITGEKAHEYGVRDE